MPHAGATHVFRPFTNSGHGRTPGTSSGSQDRMHATLSRCRAVAAASPPANRPDPRLALPHQRFLLRIRPPNRFEQRAPLRIGQLLETRAHPLDQLEPRLSRDLVEAFVGRDRVGLRRA